MIAQRVLWRPVPAVETRAYRILAKIYSTRIGEGSDRASYIEQVQTNPRHHVANDNNDCDRGKTRMRDGRRDPAV
jgi:hypothetical protein